MNKIVGSLEYLDFIEICGKIKSKVDTGAWRSSLHVDEIYIENDILNFKIKDKLYNFENYKVIKVKSSFGKTQTRYSIKTKVKLGDKVYKISLSLSNRKGMKYKCLIGRKFLRENDFIVDVNKRFINK